MLGLAFVPPNILARHWATWPRAASAVNTRTVFHRVLAGEVADRLAAIDQRQDSIQCPAIVERLFVIEGAWRHGNTRDTRRCSPTPAVTRASRLLWVWLSRVLV
jgi:hypothetical protein